MDFSPDTMQHFSERFKQSSEVVYLKLKDKHQSERCNDSLNSNKANNYNL